MSTDNLCRPTSLSPEETERELIRLGLTAAGARRPTKQELIIEYEKGNLIPQKLFDALNALRNLEQGIISQEEFSRQMLAIGGWHV